MKNYKNAFDSLFKEINKVVVGQDEVVKQIMVCVLADSNALLEGFPGLAKTLAVRTLSELMDLKFSRIQMTPDIMPMVRMSLTSSWSFRLITASAK